MNKIFIITTFDPDFSCFDGDPEVIGYCFSQSQGSEMISEAMESQRSWNKTNSERNKWINKIHAFKKPLGTLSNGGGSGTVIGFSKNDYLEAISNIEDLPENYKKEFIETVESGLALSWLSASKQEFHCTEAINITEIPIKFSTPQEFHQIWQDGNKTLTSVLDK